MSAWRSRAAVAASVRAALPGRRRRPLRWIMLGLVMLDPTCGLWVPMLIVPTMFELRGDALPRWV